MSLMVSEAIVNQWIKRLHQVNAPKTISDKVSYCLLYTSAISMKDKELRKLIGSRAKQRRLELNLTQPYVAEKMGVTASTIPVSYTHLDVYKRQVHSRQELIDFCSSQNNPSQGSARIDLMKQA